MKIFIKYLFICLLLVIAPYLFSTQSFAKSFSTESFANLNSNLTAKLSESAINAKHQEEQILPKAPKTFKEIKIIVKKFLIGFPKVFKKSWQEATTIWKRMLSWIKNIWSAYIMPKIQKFWNWIKSFWKKEIERRKPEIKKEFQKEKQEIRKDASRVGKSIWQRFKELIQLRRANY